MEMTKKIEKKDSDLNRLQRGTCSWAMKATLMLAIFFIIIHETAIAKGLILGTCFSIINFILLGKSIPMTLGRSRARASMVGLASILSRYVVLAIPMIVAIKSVSFNFVAVVVGIFAVQIVTLIDYIIIRPILEGR